MLLGVISMFCFGILGIFGGNFKKEENRKIWDKIGLLRRNVGNPCRGVDLRQGVGHPHPYEPEVPKWHPSGTSRHSKGTSRHSKASTASLLFTEGKILGFILKV